MQRKIKSKIKRILKNKNDKPSKFQNDTGEKKIKKKDQEKNDSKIKKTNPKKEEKKDCLIF